MKYTCDWCGDPLTLIERLDTYACMTCNRWTEDKCQDKTCGFCNDRPKTPREIKG